MKISITRALAEMTTLDNRINRAISNANLIGAMIQGKLPPMFKDEAEMVNTITSQYQSVGDLIKRRNLIKRLVIASNATTTVRVGDVEMTIAEAIDRKSAIVYEQRMLDRMKAELRDAVNHVENARKRTEERVNQQVEQLMGQNKNKPGAEVAESMAKFVKQMQDDSPSNLIDPLGLGDKIRQGEEAIDAFITNVDFALSEINARTDIVLPD